MTQQSFILPSWASSLQFLSVIQEDLRENDRFSSIIIFGRRFTIYIERSSEDIESRILTV